MESVDITFIASDKWLSQSRALENAQTLRIHSGSEEIIINFTLLDFIKIVVNCIKKLYFKVFIQNGGSKWWIWELLVSETK